MPQPMGFRRTAADSLEPKIQLVASLAEESIEGLAGYAAGIDAGVFRVSKSFPTSKAIRKISQAMPDVPWGGWLEGSSQVGIKEMVKVGCDFLVFPADTPLAILQNEEVGKILELEASLSEGLMRATSGLSIDAVSIAGEQKEGYPLTLKHLMLFQRLADLATKPLLVPIPANVTAGELQALWRAGVDAVIIAITPGQPNRVKELRQLIDSLNFPLPRRRQKVDVLLPRATGTTGPAIAEEEEEEG
ncbi:hypothetical protein ACFLUQ_00860 [Chloroflexota bacterium]